MDLLAEPGVVRLARAGRGLRSAVDSPAEGAAWIRDVTAALAELYAAGFSLPDVELDAAAPEPPMGGSEEATIRARAAGVLGEGRRYRQFFDPGDPGAPAVEGDLVGDLAEVTAAVWPCVVAFETRHPGLVAAVWDCRNEGFPTHWGPRAAHALAALHALL